VIRRCDLAAQYAAYESEIDAAMKRVLRSGRYVLAENVASFEAEFAGYVGRAHGVGLNSGTDALMMALWCSGVGPGDEVITTPFTAIPTYAAIRHIGAQPVFVDIDAETYLMDLRQLGERVSPRTKAVVAVHLFGNVVDVEQLRRIVGPEVVIVEDCAQSHGASLRGRMTGGLGDIAAFSFYPSKNLGGYGDGGIVLTQDEEVAQAIRRRRMYGMIDKDRFVEDGINSRLDELQAAVLRVKLKYLEPMNERRRELAALYSRLLDASYVTPQAITPGARSSYHVYCVLCREGRDDLLARLEECEIQANVYYPYPLSHQEGYSGPADARRGLQATEDVCRRIIALPFYPEMPTGTLERVAAAVNDFFRRNQR